MTTVPSINLYSSNTPFTPSAVNTLKSYLSRGLAVAVSIYINSDPAFVHYTGGGQILHANCTYDQYGAANSDHAVTLIGYGYKNGKQVWVVKNSWGPSWGDQGFFFLEIGKDSYCAEHNAVAKIQIALNSL